MDVKARMCLFFLLLRWEEKQGTQIKYKTLSKVFSTCTAAAPQNFHPAFFYFAEPPRIRKTLFFSNKATAATISEKTSILHATHHTWLHTTWAQPKCLCFPESQKLKASTGCFSSGFPTFPPRPWDWQQQLAHVHKRAKNKNFEEGD